LKKQSQSPGMSKKKRPAKEGAGRFMMEEVMGMMDVCV